MAQKIHSEHFTARCMMPTPIVKPSELATAPQAPHCEHHAACIAKTRIAGPSGRPIDQVQAQAVLRLLVLLQINTNAQEVCGASCFTALAANTILHTRRGSYLLCCIHGCWYHLKHISGASAYTESASNARVIDLHCMGPASSERCSLPCPTCNCTQRQTHN